MQNLLDAAGREITARLESEDAPDEEWYSDQGERLEEDDELFFSEDDDEDDTRR